MIIFGKPVISREHGAWVLLVVPFFIGSFAVPPSDNFSVLHMLLLLASSVLGMLTVEPLRLLLKSTPEQNRQRLVSWLSIYSFGAIVCFGALLMISRRWGLLWFMIPAIMLAVVKIWSSVAGSQREFLVELIGVVGLSMTAPSAVYLQNDSAIVEAVVLYLLCLIWFMDRFIFARRILAFNRSGSAIHTAGDYFRLLKNELIIHGLGVMAAIAIVILSGGIANCFFPAPFLIGTARHVINAFGVTKPETPKKIGFSEMRLSIYFGLAMTAVWRVWF